jgi:hypothetical protein
MSATNRGALRNNNDFYPTPDYTINSLFNFIDFDKVTSFLEPCKGDGAIYDKVKCSIKTYCELSEPIPKDYLKREYGKFDLIVTNPPFSIAKEFLEKSITESDCVCYLLRLNFLGSIKRKPLWTKIGTPNKLLVLTKRPSFTGRGTDATEYGWFCWDKNNKINLPNGIHIV